MKDQKTPTYILGISAFYHDSAAALIKDGEVIAAAQEERFTRVKHEHSFPRNAIDYCLKYAGINARDLSFVGFYEKPFLKFERILFTYLTYAPFGLRSFLKSMPLWLKQKLFLRDMLSQELGFLSDIIFVEHHQAHAASAFFPSPFNKAAIITADGVGEWATFTLGFGEKNKVNILNEICFPHSLGLFYSAFTYFAGFKVNSGEYKLMGLAPYGEPKYVRLIKEHLIDIKEDGSFRLNLKYFDYCAGLRMINKKFEKLFGFKARKPESLILQKYMDIACSVQAVTQEIMFKIAQHVHKITQCEKLCLAGGVALNCVANGEIARKGPFRDVWIQPASGDAGGALGVAFFIWHQYLEQAREAKESQDQQHNTLLGPEYDSCVADFLKNNKIPFIKINKQEIPKAVAHFINQQKIVGIFQGRMEFGPRALGNRSIIADPRNEKMQSWLNQKIKFRESFRPFAASVLEDHLGDFFDLKIRSPYMLFVAPLVDKKIYASCLEGKEEGFKKLNIKRSDVPAVTHVDGSCRVQSVSQESNAFFYQVIKEFKEISGCPMVINTSFNVRGEPIVCSLEDAYRCFMFTDMDYLVMGDFILDKDLQPKKGYDHKTEISQILD